MNLLVVTNNPERASFKQRIAVYLDTLRANGIDSEFVEMPPGALSRLKLYRRAGKFDALFLQRNFWLRLPGSCIH